MSEYYIDTILNVAFNMNFLHAEIPIMFDTTVLDAALLNQLSKNGYQADQPCITRLFAHNNRPIISLTEKDGLKFTTQLGFDFLCKKNSSADFS